MSYEVGTLYKIGIEELEERRRIYKSLDPARGPDGCASQGKGGAIFGEYHCLVRGGRSCAKDMMEDYQCALAIVICNPTDAERKVTCTVTERNANGTLVRERAAPVSVKAHGRFRITLTLDKIWTAALKFETRAKDQDECVHEPVETVVIHCHSLYCFKTTVVEEGLIEFSQMSARERMLAFSGTSTSHTD